MQILRFESDPFVPNREVVLELQGVPKSGKISPDSEKLLSSALDEANELAEPRAVYRTVSLDQFGTIYAGEGANEHPNPVDEIFPRAERLALFALTLGLAISDRITSLFREGDFALGYMLDSVASVMAEQVADQVEQHFEDGLEEAGLPERSRAVMRYSPGYCGWDLTGQRRVFQHLEPGRIGVTINDSCLMTPMKSVSGILIAGEPEIHYFDNDYRFCETCRTKSCRGRIRSLKMRYEPGFVWPPRS
jgi:hypothetical protein